MSAGMRLSASKRVVVGKASRRLARAGQVPAVIYGPGHSSDAVSLDRHELELLTAHHATGALLVDIALEGTKKPIQVMFKEVQRDPLKGSIVHVDLLAVTAGQTLHASLPLHLVNDPAGVKAGGLLTINVHELNVEAKPGDLPEFIEHDVSGLGMGDALHAGDIVAPKGVKILDDPEEVIASVQGKAAEVETAGAEEPGEPEVIGASSASDE